MNFLTRNKVQTRSVHAELKTGENQALVTFHQKEPQAKKSGHANCLKQKKYRKRNEKQEVNLSINTVNDTLEYYYKTKRR